MPAGLPGTLQLLSSPPPELTPVEYLLAAARLAFLPVSGFLAATVAVLMSRDRIAGVDRRTAIGATAGLLIGGTLLLADFAVGGIVARTLGLGTVGTADLLALLIAVSVLGLLATTVERPAPVVALLSALAAWAAGWTVAVVVTGARLPLPSFEEVSVFRVALSAIVPLGYPFGVALRRYSRRGERGWLGVTWSLMVLSVALTAAAFVPLPGGPAALVVPAILVAAVLALVAALPLVALGAWGPDGERSDRDSDAVQPTGD